MIRVTNYSSAKNGSKCRSSERSFQKSGKSGILPASDGRSTSCRKTPFTAVEATRAGSSLRCLPLQSLSSGLPCLATAQARKNPAQPWSANNPHRLTPLTDKRTRLVRASAAAGQKNTLSADALGLRMGSAFAQLRVMRRRVVAHFAPLAPLVNRENDRPKGDGSYQMPKPFHALNLGIPSRFSKIGAAPCWS